MFGVDFLERRASEIVGAVVGRNQGAETIIIGYLQGQGDLVSGSYWGQLSRVPGLYPVVSLEGFPNLPLI